MTPKRREQLEKAYEILGEAKSLMNHSGRHWIKGALKRALFAGKKNLKGEVEYGYCMIGGLHAAAKKRESTAGLADAKKQLASVIAGQEITKVRSSGLELGGWRQAPAAEATIIRMNDSPSTDWDDVRLLITNARKRIKQELKKA